ncbi:MAG: peptidylprolyl isomerase [Acidimicrobiales bacterium]
MANQKSQRERERRAQRDQAARRAAEKADRRRRAIAIAACGLVLLAVAGTVIAASKSSTDPTTSKATTTTTLATDKPSTTTIPGPAVSTPAAAPGATITGPTPCPAEDGSSPRTTQFAGPPPTCSDPSTVYDAVIHTSVGDIKVFLNSQLAPGAVNNFIVLSRYHYYDGAPLTSIISRTTMLVGADSTTGNPPAMPGYTMPGEHTAQGTILPVGTLIMQKVPGGGDSFAGNFMIAIGEKAADLPPDVTNFGLTLDGTDTLNAIDKAGTDAGSPTKLITITSVTIELAPITSTTTAG